jgi:hypothetical protein
VSQGCIFCGQRPTTKEHIFSRAWIEKVMPVDTPYLHGHTRGTARRGQPIEKWWRKYEADFAVKCVCETCNSGWMNRIDQAAEPFTTNMALGLETRLVSAASQLAVAAWATKLAIILDQTQDRPLVEHEDHRRFYETKKALPQSIIWLARALPPEGKFSAGGRPWALRLEKRGTPKSRESKTANLYFCTIDVNHLLLQVYIPRRDTPAGFPQERPSESRFVRKLWPTSFVPIVWPPEGAVPHDKLDTFASAFLTD